MVLTLFCYSVNVNYDLVLFSF